MPPKKSKYGKRRGGAWTEDENLCLINFWQEHSVEEQLDDPKVNNVGIYRRIALEMEEKGYDKTSEQCKAKMNTLKRSYRLCKGNMNKSGKGRTTCKYFDILDAILGTRPASSPVKIIEPLSKKRRTTDSENEQSDSDGFNDIANLSESSDNNEDDGPNTAQSNEVIESLNETTDTEESVKPSTSKEDSKITTKSAKENQIKTKPSKSEKKPRKTRLEIALGSVMEGFGNVNEKAEEKFMCLEKQKLEAEMKRMDFEKTKLEMEERQRREERLHQYNMMQMIMGMVCHNPVQSPSTSGNVPVPKHMTTHPQGVSYPYSQWTSTNDTGFENANDSSYVNL